MSLVIDIAILLAGFIAGMVVAVVAGFILTRRDEQRQKEFEQFAALEDYRAESGALNGDLIHFQCVNGHTDSRLLEQFGALPNCTQCGSTMEPVSFTPGTQH